MSSYDTMHHLDRMNFQVHEFKGAVPCFPTKAAAVEAGAEFGLRRAFRVRDRFEDFWVVGYRMPQGNNKAGIQCESFLIHTLRWETKSGVQVGRTIQIDRTYRHDQGDRKS